MIEAVELSASAPRPGSISSSSSSSTTVSTSIVCVALGTLLELVGDRGADLWLLGLLTGILIVAITTYAETDEQCEKKEKKTGSDWLGSESLFIMYRKTQP